MSAFQPAKLIFRGGHTITIEAIQPHGAVLVLRLPEWVITHASASLQSIFGAEPRAVIGEPLSALMSRQSIHRLRNILQFVMANGEPEMLMNIAMGYRRERFDLTLYADEGRAMVEIEPRLPQQKGSEEAFFLLRAMRSRLRSTSGKADVALRTARHIRSLTGYDRVMVVEFRENGGGEILADERRLNRPSRLGFRLTPEDAEMQARAFIREARVGYLPDVGYTPSPIVPGPFLREEFRNLSALGLRSFSRAHIDYLRRADIAATFVLPFGPTEAPWGAIVCQNSEPRFIPSEIRAALDFFANGTGLQIGIFGAAEETGIHAASRAARANILSDRDVRIDPEDDLPAFAGAVGKHVLFEGAGLWDGVRLRSTGLAPSQAAVERLVDVLDAEPRVVYASDNACTLVSDEESLSGVAGFLAVRFSEEPGRYLLLFRREEPRSIKWLDAESDEEREEIVSGRSAPWGRMEIEAAHTLRAVLFETMLHRTNRAELERSATIGRQELVIAELHHRVKNLLALFQSLIAKTGESSASLDEFTQSLAGRVRSLALAHDQMKEGGTNSLSMRRLIEAELAPFVGGGASVEIEGADVALLPRAFGVAALVVHELATNAMKYGALARADGALSVRWRRNTDGALELDWRERGGSPASEPGRRGFGSMIVERMISFELKGKAEVSYSSEGLSAHFMIPAEFVAEMAVAAEKPMKKRGGPPARSLRPGFGRRALVVEDSMIIAIEAEDMLRRLGFEEVEVAANRKDAERLLDAQAFDLVALDLRLAGETSLPIAERLYEAGVPFVFATGLGEGGSIPERFAHVPVVAKPYSDANLSAALSELPAATGNASNFG